MLYKTNVSNFEYFYKKSTFFENFYYFWAKYDSFYGFATDPVH